MGKTYFIGGPLNGEYRDVLDNARVYMAEAAKYIRRSFQLDAGFHSLRSSIFMSDSFSVTSIGFEDAKCAVVKLAMADLCQKAGLAVVPNTNGIGFYVSGGGHVVKKSRRCQ